MVARLGCQEIEDDEKENEDYERVQNAGNVTAVCPVSCYSTTVAIAVINHPTASIIHSNTSCIILNHPHQPNPSFAPTKVYCLLEYMPDPL
jgi:hypothetical protein